MNSSSLLFQSGQICLILSSHLGEVLKSDKIFQKIPESLATTLMNKEGYEKEIEFSIAETKEMHDFLFHRSGSRVFSVVRIEFESEDFQNLFLDYIGKDYHVKDIEYCISLHLNGSLTARLCFSFTRSFGVEHIVALQKNAAEFRDELIKILDTLLSHLNLSRRSQTKHDPYLFLWINSVITEDNTSQLLPLDSEKEKRFSKEILGLLIDASNWEELPEDLVDRIWKNNRISILGDPFFFLFSKSVFFSRKTCPYIPALRKTCELLITLEQGLMYSNDKASNIYEAQAPKTIEECNILLDEITRLRETTYISLDGLWSGSTKVEDLNILFRNGMEVLHLDSLREIVVEKMRSLEFLYFAGYDRLMNKNILRFSRGVYFLTLLIIIFMIIQVIQG